MTDKPGLTEGIEAGESATDGYQYSRRLARVAVRAAYEPIAKAVREQMAEWFDLDLQGWEGDSDD